MPATKKIARFTVEEVLDNLLPPDLDRKDAFVTRTINGEPIRVRMNSLRLHTFRKNRSCVVCGATGSYMLLEEPAGSSKPHGRTAHFNMYAEDEDGKPILMTNDHIVALSAGGADQLHNLQTMCSECNVLKGADPFSPEQVQRLRDWVRMWQPSMGNGKKFKTHFRNFRLHLLREGEYAAGA